MESRDDFGAALGETAARVAKALDALVPDDGLPLRAAMRHALLNGGKRLRAFLALETAALFRVPPTQSIRAAMAVECLHAYSLVHDDLPCMDDDDLRRGQPTVHVKWDEATAVLAGDALQALAFEVLAAPQGDLDPRVQTRLVWRLAQASGAGGMVAGQALDLAAETAPTPLDLDAVTGLQGLKTGALIVWAAEAGAILGRSDPEPMRRFAADLGLAFQIRDDILDVEGDAGAAGKRLRKDADRGKATFVTLLGLEGARARALELSARAAEALAPYGPAAGNLRLAAEFAVARAA